MRPLLFALFLAACLAPAAAAEPPRGGQPAAAIDIPGWFKESFLDLPGEIKEAAAANKRLLLYFGQEGCPYCRELMQVNFARKDIAEATRARFDAIALDIWGDREVIWIDGKPRTEKEFAALLKGQFTPTILV